MTSPEPPDTNLQSDTNTVTQDSERGIPPAGLARDWSDNLDLIKSLFLGLLLMAIFYQIFPIPFLDQGRLLSLFDNDNWVSPVIVAMTFWSLFLLWFKLLRYRAQSKAWQAFRHPAVMTLLNRKIYVADVDSIHAQLRRTLQELRVKRFERSIIYRSILRVLNFARTAS